MGKAKFAALAVMMMVSSAAFAQTSESPATAAAANTTADASNRSADTSSGGMFTRIPSSDRLSSSVIGLDVYNKKNQDIGTIKDVALDGSGLKAYIVGVGGFLGMGDHYVAVRPSAISLSYNADDQKWHAAMNTDADQLRGAPEYKYPSKL